MLMDRVMNIVLFSKRRAGGLKEEQGNSCFDTEQLFIILLQICLYLHTEVRSRAGAYTAVSSGFSWGFFTCDLSGKYVQ